MRFRDSLTSALIALLLMSAAGANAAGRGEERRTVKQATAVIEDLQKGHEYRRGADSFLSGGAVDASALAALAHALAAADEPVREQLVRLLVAVGEEADPLHAKGIPIIRDRNVIDLLIREGLRMPGPARDFALDSMEELVPREPLAGHGRALTEDLAQHPGASALLVVAKAKPPQAVPVVAKLAASSAWASKDELMIAQAALGNTRQEMPFVTRFVATRDPREKASLAKVLGQIGTPTALRALANEMRSDLIIEIPNVMQRSVRLDILAALARTYPEETFLYDNAIQDDAGYARVEEFLKRTLGTHWANPRPPFLTVRGFPHPSTD